MNYGRDALLNFTDLLATKGLANVNTAGAMKSAVSRILSDLSPGEEVDVRKIDIGLAIKRYNNKNPNAVSPSSLAEYQRRVTKAIREFVRYVDDPASYTGLGSAPRTGKPDKNERTAAKKLGGVVRESKAESRSGDPMPPMSSPTSSGLSLAFPLRADFLAQVVVPRDLKTDEARRLAAFIATLAIDYSPS